MSENLKKKLEGAGLNKAEIKAIMESVPSLRKKLKKANDADIYNKAIKRFKESKEDNREKAIRKSATKNKRYKGGLMVKPKAAKRGY